MEGNILNKFMLTRPYSWGNIIFVCLIASFLGRGTLIPNLDLGIDISFGLLSWFFVLFLSEYLQRDNEKRTLPKRTQIATILGILLLMGLREPISLVFLAIMIPVVYLYSLKTKKYLLGKISFIFRGFIEVLIVLSIYTTSQGGSIILSEKLLWFLVIVYSLTLSRNLIGDLRDVRFDRFTVPKLLGENGTSLFSILLLVPTFIVVADIHLTIPLLVVVMIIALRRDAYMLHKFYVLSTSFFLLNYLLYVMGVEYLTIFLINTLYLAAFLNTLYEGVPRKARPLGRW